MALRLYEDEKLQSGQAEPNGGVEVIGSIYARYPIVKCDLESLHQRTHRAEQFRDEQLELSRTDFGWRIMRRRASNLSLVSHVKSLTDFEPFGGGYVSSQWASCRSATTRRAKRSSTAGLRRACP
jgi:hypothetical protein